MRGERVAGQIASVEMHIDAERFLGRGDEFGV